MINSATGLIFTWMLPSLCTGLNTRCQHEVKVIVKAVVGVGVGVAAVVVVAAAAAAAAVVIESEPAVFAENSLLQAA